VDYFKNNLTIFFVVITSCIVTSLAFFGWTPTWHALLIPTASPPFADLRTVQGALTSLHAGLNPQIANPGDPWGRAMNYPFIWIEIGKLFHFENESCYLISVSTYILFYLTCCFLFLKKYPNSWVFLAMFSGASLLAMERGNNDLVVFSLLFGAGFLPSLWIGTSFLILATILKIYPIFSFPVLIGRWKFFTLLILLGLFYALLIYDQIEAIRSATPISYSMAYGAPSISALLKKWTKANVSFLIIDAILVFIAIKLYFSLRNAEKMLKSACNDREMNFFLIGGGVYVCSFIVSSNADYRLIFLTFCIPYICLLKNTTWKKIILWSVLISTNQILLITIFKNFGLAINVVAKSIVFVSFIVIFISEFISLKNRKNSEHELHPLTVDQSG
jgi:hypothetical protein